MNRLLTVIALSAALPAMAQDNEPVTPQPSTSIGIWTPTAEGQCTQLQHDRFQYTDPLTAEVFAMWHPELDPTGCSYGHTHAVGIAFHTAQLPPPDPEPEPEPEPEEPVDPEEPEEPEIPEEPEEPTPAPKWSAWMGQWKPTQANECAQELHDAYAVTAADGLLYPTWHPAVDPSGCFYGHSHGDDPATSKLVNPQPIIFGYVNSQGMKAGIHMVHRNEDHAGNKVAVGNDVPFGYTGIEQNITCNLMSKFHQGTHSPDALTNNLHEQTEQLQCSTGWSMNVQLLTQVQKAGSFTPRGLKEPVYVGIPVPPDSPVESHPQSPGGSMGTRFLPTKLTIERNTPDYGESWQTINTISAPGRGFVRFSNYWNVGNASRYYDPDQPNKILRQVDACWLPGIETPYLINSGLCVTQRKIPRVEWNSPDSLFNGTYISLRPDSWAFKMVTQEGGPEVCWFTDVLARTVLPEGTEGAVKQCATAVNHPQMQFGFRGTGGGLGSTKDQPGVHAPN